MILSVSCAEGLSRFSHGLRAQRMTTDELLEGPGPMDERLGHQVAAQSTNFAATRTNVRVRNCDRLLRLANPPSRVITFGDWLRGLMRRRQRR
jgi:hypothetical protein